MNQDRTHNRRQFITKTLSSCALCCLAPSIAVASGKTLLPIESVEEHKFLADSGMSLQEVYDFTYKFWYIPAMKNLAEQIGKEKLLEFLKESSVMQHRRDNESEINDAERTLRAWSNSIKEGCENWSDRLTFEILRDDDNLFEIKFSECLWAKTFREAKAPEIGYAGVCYQDYGETKAFNPKLKLERNKTLMEGDDCCHFKWTMER